MALRPVGSLSGYQLAWFYYRDSHGYAVVLGLIQLAGGALLLSRKTALLGAALTLPVMTNILMINVFFFIAWGALCTSAFIFASMLAVLWRHRDLLVGVFWTRQTSTNQRTGPCAALLPQHRGVDCLAGHHLDGSRFLARRWLQNFKVIQRLAASISVTWDIVARCDEYNPPHFDSTMGRHLGRQSPKYVAKPETWSGAKSNFPVAPVYTPCGKTFHRVLVSWIRQPRCVSIRWWH